MEDNLLLKKVQADLELQKKMRSDVEDEVLRLGTIIENKNQEISELRQQIITCEKQKSELKGHILLFESNHDKLEQVSIR
jgi:septal ring factor EnvC (AmiA/AmiB activator)